MRREAPVAVHEVPTRDRPLGDADALAARSLLDLHFKGVGPVHIAAEEALAIDRTNLVARLINTELTHEIAPDDARATAAAHPDDWRAWRLVEHAVKDRAEVEAALSRVCALTGNGAPECVLRALRPRYGISISVQYLLSVLITSANAWNVTGLSR